MIVIQTIQAFFVNLWELSLEAGPWLLLGLVFAGLVKVIIPPNWMARWLGKKGSGSVLRAAIIGIPLPLCSCGVLPAAVGLRKHGASKGATISFLVATPQNGVDSITLSYVLLGPFLAIARPIASLISALTAGILTDFVDRHEETLEPEDTQVETIKSCCSKKADVAPPIEETTSSCCDAKKTSKPSCCDKPCESTEPVIETPSIFAKLLLGCKFAMTDILDDIAKWLAVGLFFAALIDTFVPPDVLSQYGSGLPAMFFMTAIGVPMYICASASTPLAASLLLAGISPGTVLVFLLAGPATNIAGVAIVKKELGKAVCVVYLVGIIAGAIGSGLLTDYIIQQYQFNISSQIEHTHQIVPYPIELISTIVLLMFAIKPLRNLFVSK